MNSDETWILGAGAVAVLVALIAWIADRKRSQRQELDSVGIMPWTDIFFWSTMAAVLLLGFGVRGIF